MLIASCLLPLASCSRTSPASKPANLTAQCAPLPAFTGETCDDAVGYILNLTSLYRECAARHKGLAEAVK